MAGCDDAAMEMVMREVAKKHIKFSEDYREQLYLDQLKYPTFGWGHCFDASESYSDIKDYANKLFEKDFSRAYADYLKIIYTFNLQNLSCPRRMVILDMCYNMNYNKVAKFVNSLRMLREERWVDAVTNLQQSLWFKQVGNRAKRLVKVIIDNEYPIIPNRTASGVLI